MFFIFEDVDWSFRTLNLGFRIVYIPQAKIWHRESIASYREVGRAFQCFCFTRNAIWVHRRYSQWYHRPTFWLCFVSRWVLGTSINQALHGNFKSPKGIFWGLWGYFTNFQGPPNFLLESKNS